MPNAFPARAVEIPLVLLLILLALILALLVILAFALRARRRLDVSEVFGDISRRLEAIQDISQNLQRISQLFAAPQARGAFGETMLEALLKAWIPARHLRLQHVFRSGTRVDAVVHLGGRMVPIDSKFPLERFAEALRSGGEAAAAGPPGELPAELRRSFRRHVEDIRSKYIRPEEGTYNFALMYIPSEAVFYHAFVSPEGASSRGESLFETALRSHVLPVSPSGLLLYLQTIAYGLKGFVLSEDQQRLMRIIEQLQQELRSFATVFATLGSHLRNASSSYQQSLSQFQRLETRMQALFERDQAADTGGPERS